MTRALVKIAGGGISGMTSAITLARNGYPVQVHERKSLAGGRFYGDLQGLENWTKEIDVLQEINELGLNLDFYCKPLPNLTMIDGKGFNIKFHQERPLCYLVKRGTEFDSLDQALYRVARESGVDFRFSNHLDPGDADIVATGPRMKEVFAVDTGVRFKTSHPDIAVALVNDSAAYKGYAYLLVVDGYGCICTVMFDRFKEIHRHFEYTLEVFDKFYDIDMHEEERVGGVGSFGSDLSFVQDGRLLVGECAGLQDLLWGFGIRSAISSGHLASDCLMKDLNYAKEANQMFAGQLHSGVVIRYLFEWISKFHSGYAFMGQLVKKQVDPAHFLRKAYSFTPIHKLIYPMAVRKMRRRYPLLHI